jgi:hypothetical protein
VILTGRTGEPSELVAVTAAVLGTRLRQLLPIPRPATDAAERLALHADGATVLSADAW